MTKNATRCIEDERDAYVLVCELADNRRDWRKK